MSQENRRAHTWWKLGLLDGGDFARKRRSLSFYEQTKDDRVQQLNLGELLGPFSLVYSRAFKLGYQVEVSKAKRDQFWRSRANKRRVSL